MAGAPKLVIVRFAPWMIFKNNHPHDLMWPCALLYAAGVAERQGWSTEILDLHVEPLDEGSIVARILDGRPDVVLLDTMTPTLALSRRVAARVGAALPDTRILGVGQHASEKWDDLLYDGSPYHGVVLGEHEEALEEYFSGTPLHEIDGTVTMTDAGPVQKGTKRECKDVDALPPLTPRGLHLDRYRMRSVAVPRFGNVRWGYLLTSRGCPYPCTFCSPTLRQSYGRGFRPHAAERVVDDMRRLHTDWGVQAFYMIDDVFSLHKGRVRAICEQLIDLDLDIHWTIQTRADLLDAEMCKLLKKAKCTAVKMGIETGVPRLLELIKKKETREEMLEAAKHVRAAGMNLTAYYMLGHPTETLDEMHETMRYAGEIDADMIQVAFNTPYPGAPSWDEFAAQVDDLSELNHYETTHVNPSQVSGEEIEALQRNFYLRYYFSPRIFTRYLRNRLLYRVTDPGEWALAALSLKYLLGNRGRVGASSRDGAPVLEA